MDLTLPITAGGLAIVIGGFIGKELVTIIRKKIAAWDEHLVECGQKALVDAKAETVKEVDYARLESKVESIDSKVCELKEALSQRTEHIDRMDGKIDTIITLMNNKKGED